MTKRQVITVIVAGILVLAIIISGYVFRESLFPEEIPLREEPTYENLLEDESVEYTPEVPEEVTTTTPAKNEAPASSNPSLDTKIRFYNLQASSAGFEPSQISVISGDSVNVEFTALDGDYDLDFPYLGAYFSVTREGQTRTLPFDTSMSGTFKFSCRDFCPAEGRILGTLVVLPRE